MTINIVATLFVLACFYFIFQKMKTRPTEAAISAYLAEGATVIDVRSPDEYASGHFEPSINLPLPQLSDQSKSLDRNKTYLLCCASGRRSGIGCAALKANGFKTVINAGPWTNLKNEKTI